MATRPKPDTAAVAAGLRKIADMIESGYVAALDARHSESSVVLTSAHYHVYAFSVTYGLDSELPEEALKVLAVGQCRCQKPDGVLPVAETLTPAERNEIRERYQREYAADPGKMIDWSGSDHPDRLRAEGGQVMEVRPKPTLVERRFQARPRLCWLGIHRPVQRTTEVIRDLPHLGTFRCGRCYYVWEIGREGVGTVD